MNVTDSRDFERQYQALRCGKAVVPLRDWSSISIRGEDRHAFLHNFCTNDVKQLVPGASCQAFITNVRGKTIGHGFIGCVADELTFVGAPGQAPAIIAHLDRYIIREDVQLLDTTELRRYFLLVGDRAPRTNAVTCNRIVAAPCQLVGTELGEASKIAADLIDDNFVAVEESVFNAARIEMGFPLFGVDFDENNLPQEVARDREAISFTKGCYLGQETVARIDALGHVNQRIVGVRFFADDMPTIGNELTKEGAVVGRITSAAFSPALKSPFALAMVRREANADGTRLELSGCECEVSEFPARQLAP